MQFNRETRTVFRRTVPLALFFATDWQFRLLASECGQTPEDFMASEFVAEIEKDESYPDWVVRQVKAVLETRLMADEYKELPDGQRHTAGRIAKVEFGEDDMRWILGTFANRADVQETWAEAQNRAWAQAA